MAGLVRGMGMTSSLTIRRNAEEVPFLTPKMFTTARNTYFEPCTAFDSILHLKDLDSETNRWEMIQLLNAVRNFTTMGPSQGPNVTDLISGISGNKQKFGLGQKLWEMVADNMLAAKLQNSYWSLWRTTYNKDSSVDFFVREPSAINGLEAFDQHNSQSGRNTAMEMEASRSRILEMIGYRTVKNSLPSNFTASTTFGTPQYNPADSKYYQDDDGEMLIRTFESVDSLGRKMVNLQSDTSAI